MTSRRAGAHAPDGQRAGEPGTEPRQIDLLRVTLVFVALMVVFFAGIAALHAAGGLEFLQIAHARSLAWLIGLLGMSSTLVDTEVHLSAYTLCIDLECTAIFVIAAYDSLVLAYPASIRRKVVGIVAGTAAILVGNMVRLVSVALIAEYAPDSLWLVHDVLFHGALVLLTVVAWAIWLRGVRRDEG